jgi:hypothetical protein
MSTAIQTGSEGFQFDRQRLATVADSKREAYGSARPFPHAVIDYFLPEGVLDGVLAEFPSPREADWFAFDSPLERKLATKDDSTMGPATRHLLAELNSAPFVDFLEHLTGIEGLVPDPHFLGGGLHQIEPGGHLKVHADFNRHPRTGLERRLNVLLYLNRDWREEYGGALELWSRDMGTCEARILPLFNRCVVFSTTSTSFHGHPEPLTCPEGETRKSIALYYYSKDRPPEERAGEHNTLFQARPGEELEEPAPPAEQDESRPLRERLKAGALRVAPPILVDAWARRRRRRE